MEDKKIFTNEELLEKAKSKNLSDEELNKVSGGNGSLGWAWNAVYKIKVWQSPSEANYIFSFGDRLKIWEFFGGGQSGTVINRKIEYSSEDGGYIDKYLVDVDDESTNYWCKRDVIVYQD